MDYNPLPERCSENGAVCAGHNSGSWMPTQATVALLIFQEICLLPKAFPSSHFLPAASSLHVVFLGPKVTVFFLFHSLVSVRVVTGVVKRREVQQGKDSQGEQAAASPLCSVSPGLIQSCLSKQMPSFLLGQNSPENDCPQVKYSWG